MNCMCKTFGVPWWMVTASMFTSPELRAAYVAEIKALQQANVVKRTPEELEAELEAMMEKYGDVFGRLATM